MSKTIKILFSTAVLTLFYFIWTGTKEPGNLAVFAAFAFIVSLIYRNYLRSPIIHPKKLAYSLYYILFLSLRS